MKKQLSLLVIRILFIGLGLFGFASSAFSQSITVKKEVYLSRLSQNKIYFSDVSDFSNLNPKLEKRLKKIVLGKVSALGDQIQFTNTAIILAVRPLLQNSNVKLQIPRRVLVDTGFPRLNAENIKKQIQKVWLKSCESCEFYFKTLHLPQVSLEQAKKGWELEVPRQIPQGLFSYRLQVKGIEGSYWVQGEAQVFEEVWVPNRILQIDDRIHAEDLEKTKIEVTYHLKDVLSKDLLLGARLKTYVEKGQLIPLSFLAFEMDVERGEMVRVLLKEGAYSINVQAQAQEPGRIGDTILLKNPKSQKTFRGKVFAKNEVLAE